MRSWFDAVDGEQQAIGTTYRAVDSTTGTININDPAVQIHVLGPRLDSNGFLPWLSSPAVTVNAHSVILRIDIGQVRILLPGDLNDRGARYLLTDPVFVPGVDAHVFKVPHGRPTIASDADSVPRCVTTSLALDTPLLQLLGDLALELHQLLLVFLGGLVRVRLFRAPRHRDTVPHPGCDAQGTTIYRRTQYGRFPPEPSRSQEPLPRLLRLVPDRRRIGAFLGRHRYFFAHGDAKALGVIGRPTWRRNLQHAHVVEGLLIGVEVRVLPDG